VMGTAHS